MRERERDKHARKHARTRSAHTHAPSPPAASKARRRSASALFAAMRSRCASVSMAPVREATGRRTDAMLLKGLLRIAPGMKLGEYCECGTACVYDGGCVRRARADGRHWTRGTCIPPSLALRLAAAAWGQGRARGGCVRAQGGGGVCGGGGAFLGEEGGVLRWHGRVHRRVMVQVMPSGRRRDEGGAAARQQVLRQEVRVALKGRGAGGGRARHVPPGHESPPATASYCSG